MNGKSKFTTVGIILISAALLLNSCARDPEKAKAKYVALGQGYMKKGQFAAAAIEFRNALRLDPRFVDAYYQLAQADMAQRKWSTAYTSLERAVDLDANRLDARLDLGRLYLATREFDKAETEAQYILNQEPNNLVASQLLGVALIGKQEFDPALTALSRLVELRPDDASVYVNLGLVEVGLNRIPEAELHLKKAIAVDPKSTQASMDLANFYRLHDRLSDSLQVLQDGVKSNPDGIPLYIDWASMLVSQGKKDEAEAILERLQKQLPNSGDAAIAIGDFYFALHKWDEALSEYRRALLGSPKNLEIEKRILDLYLSTSQIQLAAALDQELMKDAPKDVLVRVGHGRLLMAQGNSSQATDQLQQVVADDVDSAQAHYFLGMAYWQGGALAQAGSELQAAVKDSSDLPMLPMVLEALARLSLTLGNPADAQTYASDLVQESPADPASRQILAEALAQERHLSEAEAQVLMAKHLAPNDPIVDLSLAQIYAAEKKWSEARKEFEVSLQRDPRNTRALGLFTDFLVARSQPAQAIALVQRYVSTNPNDASGHQILGVHYFSAKNYSAARTEFERAIQLDPNDMEVYVRLGKVFEVTGQSHSAIAQFQNALDLQPKQAPLATMVGNLYLKEGDLETARKYYEQALSADPNFPIAIANIAWVDAQEGKNLDIALGMAQKAKFLLPELPSITDTLGWVMYKRGNFASAMPLLRECIQKSPDNGEFHYHLGMNLIAAGQNAQGKKELEDALRMKLDNADAQVARQALAQVD